MSDPHVIYALSDLNAYDSDTVGWKAAELGRLAHAGIPLSDGFVISAIAYFQFLRHNQLTTKINHLLGTVNFSDPNSLLQVSTHIRNLIQRGELPAALHETIFSAYKQLGGLKDVSVSLHPSLAASPKSYAAAPGPDESFPDLHGEAVLLETIKTVWASLFEPGALYLRHEKKLDHFRLGMAVVVEKIVSPDVSGTLFTINPLQNDRRHLIIEACYGLADEGPVAMDEYSVTKTPPTIAEKKIAEQEAQIEIINGRKQLVAVPSGQRRKQKLSDAQILTLAKYAEIIEQARYFPQEVSWFLTKNRLVIRKVHAVSSHYPDEPDAAESEIVLPLLATGTPGAPGIATGILKVITDEKDLLQVTKGDILVLKTLSKQALPHLKKAGGIITLETNLLTKTALLTRQHAIPVVSGVKDIHHVLQGSLVVTINGRTGEIFNGSLLPTASHRPVISSQPEKHGRTATKLFLEPDGKLPQNNVSFDGVGLIRGEQFLRNLPSHPKKKIREEKHEDYIEELIRELEPVFRTAEGNPILYALSDMQSHQYHRLAGGKTYETVEENPLLGFHGTFRLLHDPQASGLEYEALRRLKERLELKNLRLVFPFIRTVRELTLMKERVSHHGLSRSTNLKHYLALSVPATVISLEQFISQGIDGLVIRADDLTALTLGVDPQNSDVAPVYNEENDALLYMYHYSIKTGQRYNLPVFFAGSQISTELLEELVRWGISGVSVNSHALENVRQTIYKYERKLIRS